MYTHTHYHVKGIGLWIIGLRRRNSVTDSMMDHSGVDVCSRIVEEVQRHRSRHGAPRGTGVSMASRRLPMNLPEARSMRWI